MLVGSALGQCPRSSMSSVLNLGTRILQRAGNVYELEPSAAAPRTYAKPTRSRPKEGGQYERTLCGLCKRGIFTCGRAIHVANCERCSVFFCGHCGDTKASVVVDTARTTPATIRSDKEVGAPQCRLNKI